eukprot:jgi/Chlat1/4200/Chrsp27S04293
MVGPVVTLASGYALAVPNSLFTLHVLARNGANVYYHVWRKPRTTSAAAAAAKRKEAAPPKKGGKQTSNDDHKLLFGLLFSLASFVAKIDPVTGSKGTCSFHSFTTNVYKLHYMDTPSGLKFVLMTTPQVGDMRDALQHVYSNLYAEFVVKNPLYKFGEPFRFELFTSALNAFFRPFA